jgi:hypothetical protein
MKDTKIGWVHWNMGFSLADSHRSITSCSSK